MAFLGDIKVGVCFKMICQARDCLKRAKWLVIQTATGPILCRFCKEHAIEAMSVLCREGVMDWENIEKVRGLKWEDV